MRQHLATVRCCLLLVAQLFHTEVDLLRVAVSLVGLGDTKNGLNCQFVVGDEVFEECLHPRLLLA